MDKEKGRRWRLDNHIVQSPVWAKFRSAVGTKAVTVGKVYFTLHKVPAHPFFIAYCPKVNPEEVDFEAMRKEARQHRAVVVRFDVPNVINDETNRQVRAYKKRFEKYCVPSAKETFSRYNVLLDLTPSEEEILKKAKSKTRYNVRLAERQGVTVTASDDLETFYRLYQETARRQGFYIKSFDYFATMRKLLKPQGMFYLYEARYQGQPLVAWILMKYQKTLYYQYGSSTRQHREVMPSYALMWEAIKLGKKLGCRTFDLWGATQDETDPWWGFTRFKLGFGGELVEYLPSYDLVINPFLYHLFNFEYRIVWLGLTCRQKLLRR